MAGRSIEDAILGFVRTVKDDPETSDLFRAALHDLELALDPKAGKAQPKAGSGTSSSGGRSSSGQTGKPGTGKPGTQGG